MKKFILIGLLCLSTLSVKAAVFSTNIVASAVTPTFLLLPSRADIYQIMLVGGAASTVVNFFDQSTRADPYFGTNYVTGAYATNFTYATNYVTSFVGYNGVTNWTTNVGVWTISVTNIAATNPLPILGAFVVNAGQTAVYQVDQLHAKGVVVQVGTNVGVTFYYRSGQ